MRCLLHVAMMVLALSLVGNRADAAQDYPNTYYPDAERDEQVYGVELDSLFDGAQDHYFARFPKTYDRARTYPVLLWFHAAGKDDKFVGEPNMLSQISDDYGLIVLSLWQRGDSWLGDQDDEQPPKQDIEELVNQLAVRYFVSYVMGGGASLGGYVPLRLAQLYPEKMHVVLAAATALGVAGSTGTEAIYQAGSDGLLDEQLIYDVVGTDDGLIGANRELDGRMAGKPYWRFIEVAGAEHINFWSDDWNGEHGGGWKWLAAGDTTPHLWDDIHAWAAAHPAISQGHLEPTPGWRPPSSADAWYLTDKVLAYAGRPWPPGPTPDGGGRPDGTASDRTVGDRVAGRDGGVPREGGGAREGGAVGDGAHPVGDGGSAGEGGKGGGGGGCHIGSGARPRDSVAGIPWIIGLGFLGWAARRRARGLRIW